MPRHYRKRRIRTKHRTTSKVGKREYMRKYMKARRNKKRRHRYTPRRRR